MPYLICQYHACQESFYVKPSHAKHARYHSKKCRYADLREKAAAKQEKQCGLCEALKSMDEFHESRTRPDGRQNICKSCISERDKADRRTRGLKRPEHPHLDIDPQTGRFVSVVPLIERFWSYVSRSDDPDACWPWTGATDDKGYGTITIRRVEDLPEGLEHKPNDLYFAHRLSYAMLVGPIQEGLDILHTCDNPPCIRPSHLYPGTDTDNARDRSERQHTAYGERNPNARMTDDMAREIFSLKGKYSSLALEKLYPVCSSTILSLWNKKTWKHIHKST